MQIQAIRILRGRMSIRQACQGRGSELEEVPEPQPIRAKQCRYPAPAPHFASFMTAVASSSPIRGTSAPRVICAIAASKRWRRQAPAQITRGADVPRIGDDEATAV